jgi:predicted MPP superfamily phosphohydrolase
LLLALVVAAVALGGKAFWLEPASLSVREHVLELPRWPAGLAGLRVAVLADLHVGSPHNGIDNLRRVVELTAEARPDLVLVPGDVVINNVFAGNFVPPEEIAAVLAELKPPLGVLAVLGNHDHWSDAPRVAAALRGVGIPVLEDESVRLERDGVPFRVAGVTDFWEGEHDIGAALADVPPGAPTILFTHNPDLFPEVPDRVALTVASHTHGGQVRLPLVGRPITFSRYGQRYAAGHVAEEGRHLFVSTGIGTSVFPVRFRVPPEISILELQPERTAP